jgi:hypothetical protein
MSLSLAFAAIGLAVIIVVAVREHTKVIASRRALLDRCTTVLSNAQIIHGGDGFPGLEGYCRGRFVRLELIPDTMTIRRLPQLWLKLTRLEPRPNTAEFSVLVRPSGAEFYSLTSEHPVILSPPSGLVAEMTAKGNRAESQWALEASSPVLRRLFSDRRTKEIAVTRKGLRLICQAAEGHRGEHLLFRQCRFENASVDPAMLAHLLSDLDDLGSSLDNPKEARAA